MSSHGILSHLIDELAKLALRLGWYIAIEDLDDSSPVQGLIVGNKEFIHELVLKSGTKYKILGERKYS